MASPALAEDYIEFLKLASHVESWVRRAVQLMAKLRSPRRIKVDVPRESKNMRVAAPGTCILMSEEWVVTPLL